MTLRAFITVIGAAAILAAGGCGSKQEQEPTVTRPQGNSVSANIVQVSEAEWPVIFTAIGTVRNRVTTQVSSRVMAYVREVRVHTGDRVQAGQRLIVMDGRDFETRERQAQAAREEPRPRKRIKPSGQHRSTSTWPKQHSGGWTICTTRSPFRIRSSTKRPPK
jgi:multidrug efflux pump subunit AcrA (membrane-fusion protein)